MPAAVPETERLSLTPEERTDAPWLAELFTARGGARVSVAEARAIAAMQQLTAEHGIGVLVLRARDLGRPLGYCGIVPGRSTLEEPELAYELLPRVRRQGYATEAARAVVESVFATGRSRIWATVREWNAPSFRVPDELGFTRHHVEGGDLVWMEKS